MDETEQQRQRTHARRTIDRSRRCRSAGKGSLGKVHTATQWRAKLGRNASGFRLISRGQDTRMESCAEAKGGAPRSPSGLLGPEPVTPKPDSQQQRANHPE